MSTITILKRLAPFETMFRRNWKTQILSLLTGQHLQPTYAEYLSLNQALQKGDTAMDQVIVWMMQNPKLHRQYFETALFQGLDQLAKPIPELNAFVSTVQALPDWVNKVKIEQPLNFTHRLGINNGFILRDLSLMSSYLYPEFNQPLLLTGALKKQGGTRLAETTKW